MILVAIVLCLVATMAFSQSRSVTAGTRAAPATGTFTGTPSASGLTSGAATGLTGGMPSASGLTSGSGGATLPSGAPSPSGLTSGSGGSALPGIDSTGSTGARRGATPDAAPDNRSLARGLELLRAFRPGAESLGNGELAERCGLSRATVSRLTQTLLRAGFLEHDAEARRYRLGVPVLSLALARRSGSLLLQNAAAPMRELAERARINVGLALADRDDMVYLESFRYARRVAQRTVVAGQRVPIELTALGRAWLAWCTDEERAATLALLRARTDAPALRRELNAALADVERQGWCWACWQPEVLALATPLALPGHPVHVLNVSTTTRLDPRALLPPLADELMALAVRLRAAATAM